MKRALTHSAFVVQAATSIAVFIAIASDAMSVACYASERAPPKAVDAANDPRTFDTPLEQAPATSNEGKGLESDNPTALAKEAETGTSRHAEILLRAARNSVALNDIPEALARFETLLRLAPRNYQARFEYAGLLLQAGQVLEGRRQLEQLVAEQERVGVYRLALADVLLRLKDYQAAREHLRQLLSDRRLGRQAAIKMARSLVLDHRMREAQRFFDEHLNNLSNLDATDELELARLLIDMERPEEAVRLLTPRHEANRSDEVISTILLLAEVRLNKRLQALELIGRIEQQPLKDAGLWLDLAARFYDEQAYPEALALFRQVWRRYPDQRLAALGVARTHLRLYQVEIAKQVLDKCAGDPDDLAFSTAMADYHILVGEYSEAIALAKHRLRIDEGDLQAVVILGDAYHASRQFHFAEAAYGAALANRAVTDEEQRREIRRLQAKNYFLSRRFDQAVAILEELIEQRPSDIGSRILLIETLTELKHWDAAAAIACPTANKMNPRDRLALDTQFGYVLLKQGRWTEASGRFLSLAADPNAHLPDVAYGLYRAATMLGQPEAAREALALGPSPLAPVDWWSVLFADRAMAYCDCHSAGAVLNEALKRSPRNVTLLIRRGEASQLCDCDCRRPDCSSCFPNGPPAVECDGAQNPPTADGWFQAALEVSPTNIRARLGWARSFNKHLEYEDAYIEYLALLKLMPYDVNVIRETAQLVESWRGFECASNFYVDGQSAVTKEKASVSALLPPATGIGAGNQAGVETRQVQTLPGGELLWSEYQARCLRGWRAHQAIPAYENLIDMEPTNQSALFDLAQSQSALNRTQCAMDTYERLLDVNPCHQDAAVALSRNQLEMRPKVIGSFDFEDQRGRQGLANMTWFNYTLSERQSLGDENEYFEWGYRERILQPTDDRADLGEIPFMRWQKKYAEDSVVFAEIAVEKYQYGLKTRPTFTVGLDVLTMKDAEIRVSGFLKNYYVCGEAIRQDIYTTGLQIDGVLRPRRRWTLSGYYRIANFSDNNWVNWFNLNSAHMIMEGRRQIRGLIDYNFYSFAQQTIFGPIPGSLVGTIHPYWSPSGYSVLSSGLEWKHWLSCDTFKAGNQHFYSVFAAGAVDSNGVGYFLCNTRWQRDISEWLTWTVEANLIRSPNQVYNAVGAATYGVVRIP